MDDENEENVETDVSGMKPVDVAFGAVVVISIILLVMGLADLEKNKMSGFGAEEARSLCTAVMFVTFFVGLALASLIWRRIR